MDALFWDDKLLGPSTLNLMLTDAVGANYGMGVVLDGDWIGHTGGDLGYSTNVLMDTNSGDLAIVLLASVDGDTDWVYGVLE